MSLLKFIKAQLGISSTPSNNFTLDASAQDGSLNLSRGNAEATTQDIMTVDSNGAVSLPNGLTVKNLPTFQCRAWVTFNATNGAIIDGGNVASVVRNAAGVYTLTFSTNMPHANYAFGGGVTNPSTAPLVLCQNSSSGIKTVSSLAVSTAYMSGTVATNADGSVVTVYVFC